MGGCHLGYPWEKLVSWLERIIGAHDWLCWEDLSQEYESLVKDCPGLELQIEDIRGLKLLMTEGI